MQGTLRIEFPAGFVPGPEYRVDGLPLLPGPALLAALEVAYRQMVASCPATDPDGNGGALFGPEGRLQAGDATLPPEDTARLRAAMERPDARAVRDTFSRDAFLSEESLVLVAPISLADGPEPADAPIALLDRLARLVRWLPGTDTSVRLRIRWQTTEFVETPGVPPTADVPAARRERRVLVDLQRRLYRHQLRALLESAATEAARRAVGIPRAVTLHRVRLLLADPGGWRDALRAGLGDSDGAIPTTAQDELRRATVGGNRLLNVLRMLPDLTQTPTLGPPEREALAGGRLVREETARRLWNEVREEDESLRWFGDRLLHGLRVRARGGELPSPPGADGSPAESEGSTDV